MVLNAEAANAEAAVGAFLIVWLVMMLIGLAIWIVCLVVVIKDSGKFTPEEYQASGQTKTLWIVLTVFFTWLGLLLWFLIPRKKLLEVRERGTAGYAQPPMGYAQPPMGYGQPPAGYGQPPAGYGQAPAPQGEQEPPTPPQV